MSCAIKAKSAWARAGIAARMLKTINPHGERGLCRPFDDCFEMGDGDAVVALLIGKAATDPEMRERMRAHNFKVPSSWAERAETLLERL